METLLQKKCREILALDQKSQIEEKNRVIQYFKERSDITDEGCWLWKQRTYSDGYVRVSWRGNKFRGHRVSFAVTNNFNIPVTHENGEELVLRHKCRNKHCVAPDHVEIGTTLENAQDRRRDGTQVIGEDHVRATITEQIAKKIISSRHPISHPKYRTQKQRAEDLGVSFSIVKHIDAGDAWAHLPRQTMPNQRRKSERKEFEWTEEQMKKVYDRVMERVTVSHDDEYNGTKCLLWTGPKSRQGYGTLKVAQRPFFCHIAVCQYKTNRRREANEVTRHLCSVKHCCNPDHLIFGTPVENAADHLDRGICKGFKVTREIAEKIREEYSNGVSQEFLATMYGISICTVRDIVIGRTWKPRNSTN